ncbi:SDR family oxidoreductase [Amycolatopsis sp. WGS_07]|uniref:SDR family oxidoreductase n=1 Tax=Amycolatopsis sp. WGS_07 TaxID=3076764 RepID=UPI003873B746
MTPERKNALITGANKGLGLAVARRLAELGMTVLLGSRDPGRGQNAAAALAEDGLQATPVHLDVTDQDTVRAAAERVEHDYGRLDVLVNNAGTLIAVPAPDITADHFRDTYETNVFGVVTVTRLFLPLLRRSLAPRVVNVASTTASHALTAEPGSLFAAATDGLAYASSKAALTMLTLKYAQAFLADPALAHVKINAVTPGYIATDLNGHAGPRTAAQGADIVAAMATLADDGPTGGFFNDDGAVPW